MQFESFNAIIDFAITKEKEAAEFYERASGEEYTSGSKEMFKELSQEERKHQEFLENLENESIEESLDEYKLEWIGDLKRSDYITDMEYSTGMGYRDILILAMKREERALKLYNDLLQKAERENHKRLFKILCQEEAKHKLRLETMYDDYMAEMGD